MKKMRFFLLVSLIFMLFSFRIFAADELAVKISMPNGGAVAITHTENIFYLPSAADIRSVVFTNEAPISYTVKGETKTLEKGEALDLTPAKTADARGAECYIVKIDFAGKKQTFTFYHAEQIPSIFVSMSKELSYIEGNKNNRDKEAEITMLDADGTIAYAENGTKSEIKARGNATFTYYKKPYQIKLGEKTALFGMEKAKTWILLANYTDQSAVRNAMAFTFGEMLDIPYNIDYRFADLYIDGEYRGLYMLTEKVQVGSTRVDIEDLEKANEDANDGRSGDAFSIVKQTDGEVIENTILSYYTYASGMESPTDITGGYIVELDINRGLNEPSHFVTENGMVYTVKAPEYDVEKSCCQNDISHL